MSDRRMGARHRSGRDLAPPGRLRSVVYLLPTSTGLEYLTAEVIWHDGHGAVPSGGPRRDRPAEARAAVRAEFPMTVPVSSIILVADTADASLAGFAAAQTYEVAGYRIGGTVPNCYTVWLQRRRS